MSTGLLGKFLPVWFKHIYSNISKINCEINFEHFDAHVGFKRF